jgi:lysophospholipase L1-like esterase
MTALLILTAPLTAPPAQVERNEAAAAITEKHKVAVDDLFTAITPHLESMQNPNDVHFNTAGYEFLGQCVADAITDALQ